MKGRIIFIAVLLTLMFTAQILWSQTNQDIVNATAKYYNGQYVGECRHFITLVMNDVGIQLAGGYRQAYLDAGIEVNSNEVKAGDILQIYDNAEPENSKSGYHSAIILENRGNGKFYVVHSNWNPPFEGKISRDEVNFFTWAANRSQEYGYTLTVHFYRLSNLVGLFPGGVRNEPYTSGFIAVYQSNWGEPVDNGGGKYVHLYHGMYMQDFRSSDGMIRHLIWNNLRQLPALLYGGIAEEWFRNPEFYGPPLFRESTYPYKSNLYANFNQMVTVQKFGTDGNNIKTILWTNDSGARHCPVGTFELVEPTGYFCWEYLESTKNERFIGSIPTGKVIFDVGSHHIRIRDGSGKAYGSFSVATWEGNNQVADIDPPPVTPPPPEPPPPENPVLYVYGLGFDFDTNYNEADLEIKNNGTGTLSWSVSFNQNWLTFSQTSGSLSAGQEKIVKMYLDRSKIVMGDNYGTLTINSNGGSKQLSVRAKGVSQPPPPTPESPSLNISNNNLDFGVSETQKTFQINNAGNGTLNWNITDNRNWLSCSRSNGSNSATITVYVDRSLMAAGVNTGIISVTSNGGNQTINVTATKESAPPEPPPNPANYFADDFEDGQADGWLPLVNSHWSVVRDEGDYSYFLNASNYAGDEYSLLANRIFTDFDLSVRVKTGELVDNSYRPVIAILFGYQNSNNFYYLKLCQYSPENILYRTVNGQNPAIASYSGATIQDNHYHLVRILRQGENIKIYFDQQQIMNVNDHALLSGKIALGSYRRSVYFDDVSIYGSTAVGNTGEKYSSQLPDFTLGQNYPNPFNAGTNIFYSLAQATNVTLKILDAQGRVIATLVQEKQTAGPHWFAWQPPVFLASGNYFCQLQAGRISKTIRLVLLK